VKLTWNVCLKVGISVFLVYLCIHYWQGVVTFLGNVLGAAFPLILGCALAYVVNLLMSFYEAHYFPNSPQKIWQKTRRPVCMTAAFLSLAGGIMLIIGLVLPQLLSCIQLIISELPKAIAFLLARAEDVGIIPEDILEFLSGIDWKSRIGNLLGAFTSGMGNVMDVVITTVTSVFSGIVTGFLSLIFAIYLLISKDTLKRQVVRLREHYLPQNLSVRISYVVSVLDDSFHRYIVGQCLEAVILGLLCLLGMSILRFPYAAMISALIAFTALIPVAGAYIGAAVGAFMILTVSPLQALGFLLFIVILQQLEGNIIYPRVVGSSLGLPGLWVLGAVTIGGGMMGVLGMLLGVPIVTAIYRILRDDMNGKQTLRPVALQVEKNKQNAKEEKGENHER